jgi:hypothetical protein
VPCHQLKRPLSASDQENTKISCEGRVTARAIADLVRFISLLCDVFALRHRAVRSKGLGTQEAAHHEIAAPPEPGYLSYIRYKLATVAPEFVAAGDHQLP